ncbi:MAG: DUF1573 domain-containing protein, partial [Cyclobacteriaceae bacterium]|nr:DUF1573 domain-containing protein [Cyclobacteriaceae bacterium]
MSKLVFYTLVMGLFVFGATSCANKDAEKRIAELENRLKEVESSGGASTASSPVATPTPEPEVKPEGPIPSFEFEKTDHDFGTITDGDIVKHTFTFKNTGDAPLIIQSARGSCGCTV